MKKRIRITKKNTPTGILKNSTSKTTSSPASTSKKAVERRLTFDKNSANKGDGDDSFLQNEYGQNNSDDEGGIDNLVDDEQNSGDEDDNEENSDDEGEEGEEEKTGNENEGGEEEKRNNIVLAANGRRLPIRNRLGKVFFSEEEENYLREGVNTYGRGNWAVILNKYDFHKRRTPIDLKDKWRTMQRQEAKEASRN